MTSSRMSDSDLAPAVLVVLDVDGTVSPIPPQNYGKDERWQARYQWRSSMPFDDEMIAALDAQVARPGVSLAWLTSWPEYLLDNLVENALGGRLRGSYISPDPIPFGGIAWRTRSVFAHLATVGNPAVIWADDMQPKSGLSVRFDQAGHAKPRLFIRPQKQVGITRHDVDRIRRFIDDQLEEGTD